MSCALGPRASGSSRPPTSTKPWWRRSNSSDRASRRLVSQREVAVLVLSTPTSTGWRLLGRVDGVRDGGARSQSPVPAASDGALAACWPASHPAPPRSRIARGRRPSSSTRRHGGVAPDRLRQAGRHRFEQGRVELRARSALAVGLPQADQRRAPGRRAATPPRPRTRAAARRRTRCLHGCVVISFMAKLGRARRRPPQADRAPGAVNAVSWGHNFRPRGALVRQAGTTGGPAAVSCARSATCRGARHARHHGADHRHRQRLGALGIAELLDADQISASRWSTGRRCSAATAGRCAGRRRCSESAGPAVQVGIGRRPVVAGVGLDSVTRRERRRRSSDEGVARSRSSRRGCRAAGRTGASASAHARRPSAPGRRPRPDRTPANARVATQARDRGEAVAGGRRRARARGRASDSDSRGTLPQASLFPTGLRAAPGPLGRMIPHNRPHPP